MQASWAGEKFAERGSGEESRVGSSMIGKEDAYRDKYESRDPHADRADSALADSLFGDHTDDIIDDEEKDRSDERQAEAALTDDRAEGSADKEEEEASEREGILTLPLDIMEIDELAFAADRFVIQVQFLQRSLSQRASLIEGIGVKNRRESRSGAVESGSRSLIIVKSLHFKRDSIGIIAATLLEGRLKRADSSVELTDIHHLIVTGEEILIGLRVGERRDIHSDCLSVELDAGKRARVAVMFIGQFVIRIAIFEDKEEVAVIGSDLHKSLLSDNDRRLVEALRVVEDEDIVKRLVGRVLMVDADDIAVDIAIEFGRAYIDSRFFASDIVERLPVVEDSLRHDTIREKESDSGKEQRDDSHRSHHAAKGDAAGLDSDQFVFFAEVAHSHDRSEEDGDRESHRDESSRGIEQQFGDAGELEALTHHIVDILPDELHKKHKDRDRESKEEGAEERAEDKAVEFLHRGKEREKALEHTLNPAP